MGQRTQILVIREKNNGERNARFYHHQWGIGRNMYHLVMDALMCDYNKQTFKSDYDFFKNKDFGTTDKLCDITDYVDEKVLAAVDPDDLKTIQDVFAYGDNNNGGCVIYIREGEKNYDLSSFKIGFFVGFEETCKVDEDGMLTDGDEKPFEKWYSPTEYASQPVNRDCADAPFMLMFNAFCEYYGIETFKNS